MSGERGGNPEFAPIPPTLPYPKNSSKPLTPLFFKGEFVKEKIMKVRDVLKYVFVMVGEDELANKIDTITEDELKNATGTEEDFTKINLAVNVVNMIIKELAENYIPQIKDETFTTQNGHIADESYSEMVVKIIDVLAGNGRRVPYVRYYDYIITRKGRVIVRYAYTPKTLSIGDSTGYTEKDISSVAISYGVAADYCLSEGRFDEASMWRKRFSEAVEKRLTVKSKTLKRRGWLL